VFFTIKEPGKGTGWASTVYGIVNKAGTHYGFEVGVGTTFKIYLRLSTGRDGRTDQPADALPTGHGTVLLRKTKLLCVSWPLRL
jgi:hypothetical protein